MAHLIGIFLTKSVENAHFNLPLSGIGWMVLENFDGHNFIGSLLPALRDLAKGASSEELQDLIVVIGRLQHLMLHQLVVPLRV